MIKNLILTSLMTFGLGSPLSQPKERMNRIQELQVNVEYKWVDNPLINVTTYEDFQFVINNTLYEGMSVSQAEQIVEARIPNVRWDTVYYNGTFLNQKILFKTLPTYDSMLNFLELNLTKTDTYTTILTQNDLTQIANNTQQTTLQRPEIGINTFHKRTSNYQDNQFYIERSEYWIDRKWNYTTQSDMETNYASIIKIKNYTKIKSISININGYHQTISNTNQDMIITSGNIIDDFKFAYIDYDETTMEELNSYMDYAKYMTFPYGNLSQIINNATTISSDNYTINLNSATLPATTTLNASLNKNTDESEYYFVIFNNCDNELLDNYVNRQILENSPSNTLSLTITYESINNGNINIEVVDVPGVMFTILGMPFTFISNAFNLTLFPGTAYSVDIGNLILGILTLLIIIFIVRTILKKV